LLSFEVIINKSTSEIPSMFSTKENAVFSSLIYKHRWPFSIFRKQRWPSIVQWNTLTYSMPLYFPVFRRPRPAKLKYLRIRGSNFVNLKIFLNIQQTVCRKTFLDILFKLVILIMPNIRPYCKGLDIDFRRSISQEYNILRMCKENQYYDVTFRWSKIIERHNPRRFSRINNT